MEDGEAANGEEAGETNRGNVNRRPRKKEAAGVERAEEGNAEAAISHGVEQAVAGGGEKEIGPQREAAKAGSLTPDSYDHDGSGQ